MKKVCNIIIPQVNFTCFVSRFSDFSLILWMSGVFGPFSLNNASGKSLLKTRMISNPSKMKHVVFV